MEMKAVKEENEEEEDDDVPGIKIFILCSIRYDCLE